jgi:hypothetical protein
VSLKRTKQARPPKRRPLTPEDLEGKVEAFWSKVTKAGPDDCWLFKGGIDTNGYGAFGVGHHHKKMHRKANTHRVAFLLANGSIPKGTGFHGTVIRHLCESRYLKGDFTYRLCCNPAHLRAGTQAENAKDTVGSGRHVSGPGRGRREYSDDQVREMRAMKAAGFSHREIGEKFGAPLNTVSRIVNRVYYRNVPYRLPTAANGDVEQASNMNVEVDPAKKGNGHG